jgi:hypothetical protein
MLETAPRTQSATGAIVNTRKAGGRKVVEKQMQVGFRDFFLLLTDAKAMSHIKSPV